MTRRAKILIALLMVVLGVGYASLTHPAVEEASGGDRQGWDDTLLVEQADGWLGLGDANEPGERD